MTAICCLFHVNSTYTSTLHAYPIHCLQASFARHQGQLAYSRIHLLNRVNLLRVPDDIQQQRGIIPADGFRRHRRQGRLIISTRSSWSRCVLTRGRTSVTHSRISGWTFGRQQQGTHRLRIHIKKNELPLLPSPPPTVHPDRRPRPNRFRDLLTCPLHCRVGGVGLVFGGGGGDGA